jgi:hypothetical protein
MFEMIETLRFVKNTICLVDQAKELPEDLKNEHINLAVKMLENCKNKKTQGRCW